MRRRDVIQALCGLLGVGALATRRVRAAAPREICSLVCTSPEPPTTTRRRLPTAYAPGSVLRFGGSPRTATMRSPSRSLDRRDTRLPAPPAQRDARPADGRRQAPICAGRIGRAARQLAEHPGLAVPGRCLNRPRGRSARSKADPDGPMPEPELDPGSADWHGRTRRPPPAGAGSVVNRCGGGWSCRGRRAVRLRQSPVPSRRRLTERGVYWTHRPLPAAEQTRAVIRSAGHGQQLVSTHTCFCPRPDQSGAWVTGRRTMAGA